MGVGRSVLRAAARCGAVALLGACAPPSEELPVLLTAPPLPEAARVVDLTRLEDPTTRFHADSVPDVGVGRLVGPAVVVDVASAAGPLAVEDLLRWEARHGAIPAGAIVLARAGSSDAPDLPDAPDAKDQARPQSAWSEEAARFLTTRRAIAGAGSDAWRRGPAPEDEPSARRVFVDAGHWTVEALDGLARLPEAGATVVVLPVGRPGDASAPARAIALLPR